MYLFSPKTSKNGSRKSFIKFIWTASDKLCHLVYIIFPVKIHDSHLTCKVANKFLNVRERVEVVEWNKRWSLPFPCCPVNRQCLWKKTLIEKKFLLWLDFRLKWMLLVWFWNISLFRRFSTLLSLFTFWKISFYITAFDWLRINNKCFDWLTNLQRADFSNSL